MTREGVTATIDPESLLNTPGMLPKLDETPEEVIATQRNTIMRLKEELNVIPQFNVNQENDLKKRAEARMKIKKL